MVVDTGNRELRQSMVVTEVIAAALVLDEMVGRPDGTLHSSIPPSPHLCPSTATKHVLAIGVSLRTLPGALRALTEVHGCVASLGRSFCCLGLKCYQPCLSLKKDKLYGYIYIIKCCFHTQFIAEYFIGFNLGFSPLSGYNALSKSPQFTVFGRCCFDFSNIYSY